MSNLKKQEFVGSTEFVLGQLCASPNQEIEKPIQNLSSSMKKNNAKIKIMCVEKKDNYGKHMAQFTCNARLKQSGNCFLTISKFKGNNKFQPIYKPEAKPPSGQGTSWNKIFIDTDTLYDSDND